MEIRALSYQDLPKAQALLRRDAAANVFPLGVLEALTTEQAPDRMSLYLVWPDGKRPPTPIGFLMVTAGGLTIPFIPLERDARTVGRWLVRRHEVGLLVGPRTCCDALWKGYARGREPALRYDQRLMVAHQPPPPLKLPGFRLARPADAASLEQFGSAMMLEDLGFDPAARNPTGHRRTVAQRIAQGLTWVVERRGALYFKIDVGNWSREGVTVGGTYVPPQMRGHGIASAAMKLLLRHLLARHPRVTLHLNEANAPAMNAYLNAGFQQSTPLRLILSR